MAAAHCHRPCPLLAPAIFLSWTLLLSTTVFPQTASGPTTAGAASTHTITGTVVNSVTGDPIHRALVQIGPHLQLTDGQGRFALGGIRGGQIVLQAQKPGFFAEGQMANPINAVAVETISPGTNPIVIKLIPEAVIFGRITDQDGEPAAGVYLRVRGWHIIEGRRQLQDISAQATDEDGRFRVFNLPPGTYYVLATMAPHFPAGGGYPQTYFPGVTQFSAAPAIQLAAGQNFQADFALHQVPTFQVTGQITGYSRARAITVQMMAASDPTTMLPVEVNSATGSFGAHTLPAGSYKIEATVVGEAGQTWAGSTPVDVSSNLTGVMVAVAPPISIPVIVQTEFSNASLGRNPALVSVRLLPTDPRSVAGVWSRPERHEGQLGSVLTGVRPGRYYVEIARNGNWYAQSLVSGSSDLFSEPLTVESSQVAPIQVLLRDDGARLSGEVRADGSGVSANVLAIMQGAPLRVPWRVMSNVQGAFQFDNLPPGEYTLLAFDTLAGLEYANREALRDYLSQGTHVTLGPKDTQTVNLDLIHR